MFASYEVIKTFSLFITAGLLSLLVYVTLIADLLKLPEFVITPVGIFLSSVNLWTIVLINLPSGFYILFQVKNRI
jgi:hypothetical protein